MGRWLRPKPTRGPARGRLGDLRSNDGALPAVTRAARGSRRNGARRARRARRLPSIHPPQATVKLSISVFQYRSDYAPRQAQIEVENLSGTDIEVTSARFDSAWFETAVSSKSAPRTIVLDYTPSRCGQRSECPVRVRRPARRQEAVARLGRRRLRLVSAAAGEYCLFTALSLVDDQDLGLVQHLEVHRARDEALRARLVMELERESRITGGDGHHRPERHRGEVATAIRGLLHHAGRRIGIADDDNPVARCDVQIAQQMALCEGPDEQFLRVPAVGVAEERAITRARDVVLSLCSQHMVASIVPVSARTGAPVARPVESDSVMMFEFHDWKGYSPRLERAEKPAES